MGNLQLSFLKLQKLQKAVFSSAILAFQFCGSKKHLVCDPHIMSMTVPTYIPTQGNESKKSGAKNSVLKIWAYTYMQDCL